MRIHHLYCRRVLNTAVEQEGVSKRRQTLFVAYQHMQQKIGNTVKQQTTILFASSASIPDVKFLSTINLTFRMQSVNNPLLPAPAGTTATAAAIDSNTLDSSTCSTVIATVNPVLNIDPTANASADIAASSPVVFKDCVSGAGITAKVANPSGLATSVLHQC